MLGRVDPLPILFVDTLGVLRQWSVLFNAAILLTAEAKRRIGKYIESRTRPMALFGLVL